MLVATATDNKNDGDGASARRDSPPREDGHASIEDVKRTLASIKAEMRLGTFVDPEVIREMEEGIERLEAAAREDDGQAV